MDHYPFGMLLPGRHANTVDYRYGFQGQEMDDEIKWVGNSLNYTFRMHDPRVGRFFAVDPLSDQYPYLSSYSFSGNRVIDALELEGLEPIVINGELVAYEVQPGQGPSQIAVDINNKKTQEKYGYSNEKVVTWSQVVAWNFDEFKAKGNWLDPSGIFDKNDETYKELNINEHDVLFINQYANDNFIYENEIPKTGNDIYKGELVEPFNEPFSAGFSGGDAEAGVGYSGFNASTSIFKVPKESIFWEGGSIVRMTTLGAQLTTPGLSTSMGAGSIDFSGTKEPSIKRILNSPSHTETVGGISPIGVGVKYAQTTSENYRSSLTSIVAGTPGPIVSYGNSAWNKTDITVEGLKTADDSIRRAKEILKNFPGAKHAEEYLDGKQGKARPLKRTEL